MEDKINGKEPDRRQSTASPAQEQKLEDSCLKEFGARKLSQLELDGNKTKFKGLMKKELVDEYFEENSQNLSQMELDGSPEFIRQMEWDEYFVESSVRDAINNNNDFQLKIVKKGNELQRDMDVTEDENVVVPNTNHPQIIDKPKKTYSEFILDSPLSGNEVGTCHLKNQLRYRLNLDSKNAACPTESECFEIPDTFLESSFEMFSFVESKGISSCQSLHDVLLNLVDEFDASGVAEIFRLLLERRSAIPLFHPPSKKHFLNLLRHIAIPGVGSIGEDNAVMRFAVVSCRKRNESQTSEILKSLFNIESIHYYDFKKDNVTSVPLTAEIGCGCLQLENSGKKTTKNVLVAHIIGDFTSLWQFILQFADHVIIEDSTTEQYGFHRSFLETSRHVSTEISSADAQLGKIPYLCIWKPTFGVTRWNMKKANTDITIRHLEIEGQLDKTVGALKSLVAFAMHDEKRKSASQRIALYQIPIPEYSSILPEKLLEMQRKIAEFIPKLTNWKNEFRLQQNYREQAKHEEAKCEYRLDEEKVLKEDAAIRRCREERSADARQVKDHPLLQLLLKILTFEDSCVRLMAVRMLEQVLDERNQRELLPKQKEVHSLYSSYVMKQQSEVGQDEELLTLKEKLKLARIDCNESVVNIEHLWRELSHLYTSTPPENRFPVIWEIPRLAAQHLMDGLGIELLDGESNLIHLEWMAEVLYELGLLIGKKNRERIFVLSIMGVQSSGKSTLLNTMFGVQLRTSVGQCTRGVNMQLLVVEGRPEYDYILLLDTEGTRSPEYHGLPGSEKRDNQMATLSILLADATIIVTPGENDAAVKEILPIVLMAYQGSQLAEFNGGRLSSKLFFVYNRIDTTQKDKLANIIQTLGTSLNEAFDYVQSLTGNSAQQFKSNNPFGSFNLDVSNSSDSDVFVLGNVKKEFEPPGDIPDAAYGEALVQLREHIHQRTTRPQDGSRWKSRSIAEFSNYIEEVWKCISSANFTLNFASVVERMTFDKLDFEYKKIEAKLAEAYREFFKFLKKKMVEEKGNKLTENMDDENRLASFEKELRDNVVPIEHTLGMEIEDLVKGKGREKWSLQYRRLWEMLKKEHAHNWKRILRTSFVSLFNYEHHVENYKKQMRKEIVALFKSKTENNCQWNPSEMDRVFEEMFSKILVEVRRQFPPKENDVTKAIEEIYRSSNVIKKRQIEINVHQDLREIHPIRMQAENEQQVETRLNVFSNIKRFFVKTFSKTTQKKIEMNQNVDNCFTVVNMLADKVVVGKHCYDDNIVSSFICKVDDIISAQGVSRNSEVQMVHTYGKALIINQMNLIQKSWEEENSVYVKLQQPGNKEAMRCYFKMVSLGVEKTKLFASTMANVLKNVIEEAFKKEMVQKTSNAIRNERWLHDARFMHKHLDLYLADLLVEEKLSEVLDYIRLPHVLYKEVLHRLIAQKVPDVEQEWKYFQSNLIRTIEKAAQLSTTDSNKCQKFVDGLRNEFLKDKGLQSECLAKAFLIDCSGEYDDCDMDEEKQFKKVCTHSLLQVIDNQEAPKSQQVFSMHLALDVVAYLTTLNDPAALPRCDAFCRLCRSLCIESANHDTFLRPHDAIHQPGGIAGFRERGTLKLVPDTCSQCCEKDYSFYPNITDDLRKYKDFAEVYPGWKVPRINEELPLRQYLLATYNEDIAKKYKANPSDSIPSEYFRNLATIRAQLKRETEG